MAARTGLVRGNMGFYKVHYVALAFGNRHSGHYTEFAENGDGAIASTLERLRTSYGSAYDFAVVEIWCVIGGVT